MKKLNSIEKIIIIILVVGIIVGVGAFVFVKPVFDKISPADKRIDSLTKELAELNETLARLDTIDADIEEARKSVLSGEKHFYPELTTYEANEVVLAYLKDCGLETNAIQVSGISTTSINLEAFSRSSISYPLKSYSQTAAGPQENPLLEGQFKDGNKVYNIVINSFDDVVITDEDGNEIKKSKYTNNMRAAYIDAIEKFAVMSGLSQTLAVMTVSFTMTGTYDQYLKFLDYVNDLDRATYISSVSIPVTTAQVQEVLVSDGEQISTEEITTGYTPMKDNTKMEVPITLTMYCVEPMERPKTISAGGQNIDIVNTY